MQAPNGMYSLGLPFVQGGVVSALTMCQKHGNQEHLGGSGPSQLHFDHIALKCPVFPLFHYMEDDLNMKCQLRRLDCLDCSEVVASSGPLGYSPGFLVGHSAVGYCRCKN